MQKIKYDAVMMKTIAIFQSLTHTDFKDCFEDDEQITFVVPSGQIGKAIGRNGEHLRRMESLLRKRVKVIQFSSDVSEFIRNAVHPLKIADIVQDNDVFTLTAQDSRTRGMLIGRAAQNLRKYEGIVRRYFPIKELKVT